MKRIYEIPIVGTLVAGDKGLADDPVDWAYLLANVPTVSRLIALLPEVGGALVEVEADAVAHQEIRRRLFEPGGRPKGPDEVRTEFTKRKLTIEVSDG